MSFKTIALGVLLALLFFLTAGLICVNAQTQSANYFPYKIDISIGVFSAGGSADYVGAIGVATPTGFSIDSIQAGYVFVDNKGGAYEIDSISVITPGSIVQAYVWDLNNLGAPTSGRGALGQPYPNTGYFPITRTGSSNITTEQLSKMLNAGFWKVDSLITAGGSSIYSSDGTILDGRVVTLEGQLQFDGDYNDITVNQAAGLYRLTTIASTSGDGAKVANFAIQADTTAVGSIASEILLSANDSVGGNSSSINVNTSGNLYLRASNSFRFSLDGSTELYYLPTAAPAADNILYWPTPTTPTFVDINTLVTADGNGIYSGAGGTIPNGHMSTLATDGFWAMNYSAGGFGFVLADPLMGGLAQVISPDGIKNFEVSNTGVSITSATSDGSDDYFIMGTGVNGGLLKAAHKDSIDFTSLINSVQSITGIGGITIGGTATIPQVRYGIVNEAINDGSLDATDRIVYDQGGLNRSATIDTLLGIDVIAFDTVTYVMSLSIDNDGDPNYELDLQALGELDHAQMLPSAFDSLIVSTGNVETITGWGTFGFKTLNYTLTDSSAVWNGQNDSRVKVDYNIMFSVYDLDPATEFVQAVVTVNDGAYNASRTALTPHTAGGTYRYTLSGSVIAELDNTNVIKIKIGNFDGGIKIHGGGFNVTNLYH